MGIHPLLVFGLMLPVGFSSILYKFMFSGVNVKNHSSAKKWPDSPAKAIFGIVVFTFLPLVMSWQISTGLYSEIVRCGFPGCKYAVLAAEPIKYWLSIAAWYIYGCVLLGVTHYYVKYLREKYKST
jgi:hypothetical protein